MALLGKAIGRLLQHQDVLVLDVRGNGTTATWYFSHAIALYSNPTGFEAGSDTQWFTPLNGSASYNMLTVQYSGSPLTRWQIETLPPGVTFVGGAQLRVPQSGTVTPEESK